MADSSFHATGIGAVTQLCSPEQVADVRAALLGQQQAADTAGRVHMHCRPAWELASSLVAAAAARAALQDDSVFLMASAAIAGAQQATPPWLEPLVPPPLSSSAGLLLNDSVVLAVALTNLTLTVEGEEFQLHPGEKLPYYSMATAFTDNNDGDSPSLLLCVYSRVDAGFSRDVGPETQPYSGVIICGSAAGSRIAQLKPPWPLEPALFPKL